MTDDLYKTLGVPRNATKAEIKAAKKKKAQRLHPDRNKDPAAARELALVNAAADTLEDDDRRERYDKGDSTQRPPSPEQEARHTLMQFMIEAIGQEPKVNVPAYCLNRMEARRPEIAAMLAKMKQGRTAFEARLHEVTTDDQDNIYRDLVDGFIRNLTHEIEQGEKALAVLKIAIDMARRYKSDVTVPIQRYPPTPRGVGLAGLFAEIDASMGRAGFKPGGP